MPKITFLPEETSIEVPARTRLLRAAIDAKVNIRFGCGVGNCCLCGVRVIPKADCELSKLSRNEEIFFDQIDFVKDGTIRLACQAEILSGEVDVDLAFQITYDPSQARISF